MDSTFFSGFHLLKHKQKKTKKQKEKIIMGARIIDLRLSTFYDKAELRDKAFRKAHVRSGELFIEKQSLDARDKNAIHWKVRATVISPEINNDFERELPEKLIIENKKRDKHIAVIGSGPAGFFAAYRLALSGFKVTLIEQGREVEIRKDDIDNFEKGGELNERSNYSFGEGGAGTFSDGKLTSRSKHIGQERGFIMDSYIEAGAPEEIAYLSKPHLGSDNLKKLVKKLRDNFIAAGGTMLFDTQMTGLHFDNDSSGDKKVNAVETDKGKIDVDYLIVAPGHSSYMTYKMLIESGVKFAIKSFAIGTRVEHPQELINKSQWDRESMRGLKAAEYKLTFKGSNLLPSYSFCMCPGGKVVPSTPAKGRSIVNGMSDYSRASGTANSGIVVGINLNDMMRRELDPVEALDWLDALERKFYDAAGGYAAPAVKIKDFLNGRTTKKLPESSFPLGLVSG
ncbi:MAG: FAD-dependent oxidoreductase, partial [Chlorobi bacterium]|nr:FAD-dependent oxidoreductase [Chlorobiota bacterium]